MVTSQQDRLSSDWDEFRADDDLVILVIKEADSSEAGVDITHHEDTNTITIDYQDYIDLLQDNPNLIAKSRLLLKIYSHPSAKPHYGRYQITLKHIAEQDYAITAAIKLTDGDWMGQW